MTNQSGGVATEQQGAAERIEEARQLYRNISKTLDQVLKEIGENDLSDASLLPKLATQIQTVVADIHKKEAEFDAKFGSGRETDEIDFDELRREVGCRLGRIRECCQAE